MRSRVRMAVVVSTAVVLGTAGTVHALECEGRLVSQGASPWDVQAICGAPAQVSDPVEIVLKPVYDPQGHVAGHLPVGVPKPVWTSNLGSSRLMSLLTFIEGALVKIDTGGYGHQTFEAPRPLQRLRNATVGGVDEPVAHWAPSGMAASIQRPSPPARVRGEGLVKVIGHAGVVFAPPHDNSLTPMFVRTGRRSNSSHAAGVDPNRHAQTSQAEGLRMASK